MEPLIAMLGRVRKRMTWQLWFCAVARNLVYSTSVCCVFLVLFRLFPLLGDPLPWCGGALALGVLLATVQTVRSRPALVDAALAADERLGLRERFTSSLELAEAEGGMVKALHEDARARLEQLELHRDFAFQFPQMLRWATIPVLLFGIGYLALPEFDLFGFKERQVEARAKAEKVQMQVERLRDEMKPLEEAIIDSEEAGALAEAAKLIERVTEGLERGEITEKQAVAKLEDLRESLKEQMDTLNEQMPMPKLAAGDNELGVAQDIANDIQKGNFEQAAQKAKEMAEKLEKGELSESEMEAMSKALEALANKLGAQNSELGEALAEAAQQLSMADVQAAMAALDAAELSLEDLASAMKQMDMMAKACAALGKCKGGLVGDVAGIMGMFNEDDGDEYGPGMGNRRGRGQGGSVGDLPDVEAGLDPTMLPGNLEPGQILMSIDQRAAPEMGQESNVEILQGAFVQAQQEAEQALEQEEIPRGSREFVRRYFGTLEDQQSERQ